MNDGPDDALAHERDAAGAGSAPREIELKLRATPETLETLRQTPLILRHALNQGIARRLEATYYDTADRLLEQHGVSLRVRRSGKRYVQTVKRASCGANPLARLEWETPVPDAACDLAALPLAEIGAPLDTLSADALKPVFSSKVRRRMQKLQFGDALIEIAFDSGVVEVGSRSEALAELELELKQGEPAALYDLGLALLDLAPLSVETETKAARGYRIAFGSPAMAAKAGPLAIGAADNVDAAIAGLLANAHRQVMANLAPAAAGNPDGVHQMRVALRRLRTALSLIRRQLVAPALVPIAAGARRLASELGPARNWDVFVTQTLPEIEAAGMPEVAVPALLEAAEPLRAQSHAVLRDVLADSQTTRFLLGLGQVLERAGWRIGIASEAIGSLAEPVTDFAERALGRCHRKAMKQGRHFARLPAEERHRLRLSLKKLRYACEFFLPLYAQDPAAAAYLGRLAKLQDALGVANDAATTHGLVEQLRGAGPAPELHYAAGALTGWQRREQIEAGKQLLRRWRKFAAAEPFWR